MLEILARDHSVIFAVIIFAAVMAGVSLERWRAKAARQEWFAKNKAKWGKRQSRPALAVAPKDDPNPKSDAAEQLRTVMASKFQPRALLNQGEARLLLALEKALADFAVDWRVMAQVSLGEILSSPNKDAYWAINSKRVDLLIVDAKNMPLHAVEYQGSGHHQGTAAARDAVKKEALRRAGIGYVEISKGDTPAELRATLAKLVGRNTA